MLKKLSILLLLVGLKDVTCCAVAEDIDPAKLVCPRIDVPTDGSVRCTDRNFAGSVCTFTCDDRTYMDGKPQSKCQFREEIGSYWTNNAPLCIRRVDPAKAVCPLIDAPTDGFFRCTDGNFAGSVCRFTCDDKFYRVGAYQTKCQFEEGTGFYWTQNAPICMPLIDAITCQPAEAPAHGSVSCTYGDLDGSVCTFACDEGYTMVGSSSMVVNLGSDQSECLRMDWSSTIGSWTKDPPNCIPNDVIETVTCQPALDRPVNGDVFCSIGNYIGSICTFICEEGYKMVGEFQSKCQVFHEYVRGVPVAYTRDWTHSAPICVPSNIIDAVACEPAFEAPVGGSVSCTDGNFAGSVCTFACEEKYKMIGDFQLQCLPVSLLNGSWTNNAPICVRPFGPVTCQSALEAPTDGSVSCTDDKYIGSVCTFTCDEGYTMVGSDQSECLPVDWPPRLKTGGKWTNNVPVCSKSYALKKTSRRGSFKECQEMCRQERGRLAQYSLASGYKDKMVAILGEEPTWVGVNNVNSEFEWRYTSMDGGHKPFPTTNPTSLVAKWVPGQPVTDLQLCATIYKQRDDLLFSTLTCDPVLNQRYGICEIQLELYF